MQVLRVAELAGMLAAIDRSLPYPPEAMRVRRGKTSGTQKVALLAACGRPLGTVWAMLHRFRTAMVRLGRERLGGTVEVDETFLGGPEPGRPGRGALGKTMVEVAVEQDGTRLGRCRLAIIDDAGAAALRAFLLAHVEPGSVVLSHGWPAYPAACGEDYRHEPLVIRRLSDQLISREPECRGPERGRAGLGRCLQDLDT